MIQSNLKRTLFIVLILISIQNSNQNTECTVEKMEYDSDLCSEWKAECVFDIIISSFSDKISSFDTITFDVHTTDGRKLQTTCSPYNILSTSKFICHIDVRYPLDNTGILLPTTAPKVEKYAFKNWEKTIGANPGTSNKISDVTCLPEELNTFIPSSVEIGDCAISIRYITIKGEWENKNKALTNMSPCKIELNNKNLDIMSCSYRTDIIGFECRFEGEGNINMKEQYFTAVNRVYKLKEFNSGKSSKKCADDYDDDYFDNLLSADYLHFLNKILIFMGLLLF